MTDPSGGFYSTQDGDPTPRRSGDCRSEGEQGKFFVWMLDEIREVLPVPASGGDEAEQFTDAYGTKSPNSTIISTMGGQIWF